MENNNNDVINLIRDNFNQLNNRLDDIEDKIEEAMTENDCKKNQKIMEGKIIKTVIKQIMAVGSIFVGAAIAILKIFFPEVFDWL